MNRGNRTPDRSIGPAAALHGPSGQDRPKADRDPGSSGLARIPQTLRNGPLETERSALDSQRVVSNDGRHITACAEDL